MGKAKQVTDLMAALEASLRPACQWPECCGDPDEDDFCGGCNRAAFEARSCGQEGPEQVPGASPSGSAPSDRRDQPTSGSFGDVGDLQKNPRLDPG